MVEPIYCLKPAWCGRHLAGLRPETGLTVRYGATAFKAVGCHCILPLLGHLEENPPLLLPRIDTPLFGNVVAVVNDDRYLRLKRKNLMPALEPGKALSNG